MIINENGIYREATEEEVSALQMTLEEQNAMKIAELENNLKDGETDFIRAMEKWFSTNGSGEVKDIADERIAVRNEIDSLGKVVQTEEGNGTIENPYKSWKVGQAVEEGKWYLTPINGYLWQAIKSGVPISETDKEYFDVVGID